MKKLKKIMSCFLASVMLFGVTTQTACDGTSTEEGTSVTSATTRGTTGGAENNNEANTGNDNLNADNIDLTVNSDNIVLADSSGAAPIYIDTSSDDYDGISLVAEAVAKDINLVTGNKPEVLSIDTSEEVKDSGVIIIAGTLNDKLIKDQNLNWDISPSNNNPDSEEWERYQVQVVENDGLTKIVIAGTDKRGTIYGLFYISQDLGGVSPWVWWADATPEKRETLSFKKEQLETTSKTPSVKYRGIFLNDEAPSLSTYVSMMFGDYNYLFYDHVFELILRLKGNYLWPAMWGDSFSDDGISRYMNAFDFTNINVLKPEERNSLASATLADHYGIVMGLSHHEPMHRAGVEWQNLQRKREPEYSKPTVNDVEMNIWNYFLNRDNIYDFWVDGFNRNKDFDNITPIGMRGEGDSELRNPDGTPFTLQQNIDLLKSVIIDQKEIIKNAGKEGTPQALVLYKEVEKYWYGDEKTGTIGLNQMEEIKDDIIVLCEDNNNFLRTLPMENERDRKWGLYYHFDYNGGPRTYMWLNVTPLQRVWDNMTMAYDYDVNELWIVNVGDLKPMELPISYFLDLAYDFETYGTSNPNSSAEYTANWVKQQFSGMQLSDEQVTDIAQILIDYVDMNGRKRPETIFADTFSTVNYNEAQIELAKAIKLEDDVIKYWELFENTDYADAFYQLVYYPAVAVVTVNRMWLYQGLNEMYAKSESTLANSYAELVEQELEIDKDLMRYYNSTMSGAKWSGMMGQVNHTAYTAWNHESATYPQPKYVTPKSDAELVVNVQGTAQGISLGELSLPDFENTEKQQYAVILSNTGTDELLFSIEKSAEWIVIDTDASSIFTTKTLGVYVDWDKISADETGTITITSDSKTVTININAKVIDTSSYDEMTFFPSNGVIAINSNSYSNKVSASDNTEWIELEDYGKNTTTMKMAPTTSYFEKADGAPYLEYKVYIPEDGDYTLTAFVGASNNRYYSDVVMRYGVSVDGSDEIIINDTLPSGYISGDSGSWSDSILNAGRKKTSKHTLTQGTHTIRIYGVDPGLLLEKLTLSKESRLPSSHFGPEETFYVGKTVEQQPLIYHIVPDIEFVDVVEE